VKEYIPPLNTRVRSTLPFVPNGSDPSAHDPSFAQRKSNKKDHKSDSFIGERGYDTDVQQFVWNTVHNPLTSSDRDWYAASVPFIPNGSKNQYSQHKHHHKHGKKAKDFAERGMDEEVHGFVNEAILEPINVRNRSDEPWVPNGSAWGWNDGSLAQGKHKHHKKDHKSDSFIGERGYDTDVQQFVWNTVHNPLTSSDRDWYAASVPFIPNGSKNQYAQADENESDSDDE